MIAKIDRIYEDGRDLQFIIKLYNYGKTASDLTDIICSIKTNLTDDDDAIFIKRLSDNNINYTGTDKLIVNVEWPSSEYSEFTIGNKYHLGIFCKFTGDTKADENVLQKFTLEIVQDFLRE